MRPRFALVPVLVLVGAVGGLAAAAGPAAGAGPALYPDLRTRTPADLAFDVLADGTHVLRFSNTVWNAGEGRLELEGDPHPQQDAAKTIYQNLYDAPTGGNRVSHTQVSSDVVYHPSHEHYHFADFSNYLLLKKAKNGRYRATTKQGVKTGFCIMDLARVRGSYEPQYTACGRELQGLSVGWGDVYGSDLPEQWVVLGDRRLADGEYGLRSTADPKNKLDEGGRDGNNAATAYFTVSGGQITGVRSRP